VSQLKVLISGGAGFIGSHLAESCIAEGHAVSVIDDLSTGTLANLSSIQSHSAFSFRNADVADAAMTDSAVKECDLAFHLAAAVGVNLVMKDPVHTITNNVHGTHAVLESAARYRKRIVIASTSEVYGKAATLPFREEDDLVLGPSNMPRWSYGCSKALTEFLAFAYERQLGMQPLIVRLFNTVGPRQVGHYGMVIPRFVRQALAGQPLTVFGDGSQSRCFTHVADVVAALLRLATKPWTDAGPYNIGTEEEVCIVDLARRVLSLTGSSSNIVFVPYAEAYGPGFEDMQRRLPDLSRIRKAIGYAPRHSLDDILRDVIQYEKKRLAVRA
jgi:UDP-glucose 4-epimerase